MGRDGVGQRGVGPGARPSSSSPPRAVAVASPVCVFTQSIGRAASRLGIIPVSLTVSGTVWRTASTHPARIEHTSDRPLLHGNRRRSHPMCMCSPRSPLWRSPSVEGTASASCGNRCWRSAGCRGHDAAEQRYASSRQGPGRQWARLCHTSTQMSRSSLLETGCVGVLLSRVCHRSGTRR